MVQRNQNLVEFNWIVGQEQYYMLSGKTKRYSFLSTYRNLKGAPKPWPLGRLRNQLQDYREGRSKCS